MTWYQSGIFYFMLFLFSCNSVSSQAVTDAMRNDSLLNAIKDSYDYLDNTSFTVRKLEFNGRLGYFCGAAKYNNNGLVKKDGYIMVFDVLMELNKSKKWEQKMNFNSFSLSSDFLCHFESGMVNKFSKINDSTKFCLDVFKSNPHRKELLDVIRGNSEDKFIVKRICSTSNFAYFCGVRMDSDGYIEKTGKVIDAYDVIFKKNENEWEQAVDLGLFSKAVNDVKCYFGSDGVMLNESTLENVVDIFYAE